MPIDPPASGHEPVLLNEVLSALQPENRNVIVDCTTGRGGQAKRIAPDGSLLCLDADPRNLEFARSAMGDPPPCGVRFFHANFAELNDVLNAAGVGEVHAILADLGVSTNQLFDAHYGMSFAQPMPLDMRIDPRTRQTAADLVNTMREEDLANVLYEMAQEHYSRRIARKLVEARRLSPITTTDRLAELVRSAIPRRGGAPERIDPATRTFMALRMAVNQEVDNLAALLEQGPARLASGGRIAVISFHSTEDRSVKQAFRSAEQTGVLRVVTKKPISPTDSEIEINPRARSAKMRVAEKQ